MCIWNTIYVNDTIVIVEAKRQREEEEEKAINARATLSPVNHWSSSRTIHPHL